MIPEIMKPKVSMEWDDKATLLGGRFVKVYRCADCNRQLYLGQALCSCGMPQIWEGIEAWDRIHKARKGKRK